MKPPNDCDRQHDHAAGGRRGRPENGVPCAIAQKLGAVDEHERNDEARYAQLEGHETGAPRVRTGNRSGGVGRHRDRWRDGRLGGAEHDEEVRCYERNTHLHEPGRQQDREDDIGACCRHPHSEDHGNDHRQHQGDDQNPVGDVQDDLAHFDAEAGHQDDARKNAPDRRGDGNRTDDLRRFDHGGLRNREYSAAVVRIEDDQEHQQGQDRIETRACRREPFHEQPDHDDDRPD